MDDVTIEKKVRTILSNRLGLSPRGVVDDQISLLELGADSLDIVDFILALEEEFEIRIPDHDTEKVISIAKAVKYMLSKQ